MLSYTKNISIKRAAALALLWVFLVCGILAHAEERLSLDDRYVADGTVIWLSAEDDGTIYGISDGSSILRIGNDMTLLWNRSLGARPTITYRQKDGVVLVATRRPRVEGYSRLGERVIDFALPWQEADTSLLSLGETEEGFIYAFLTDGRWAVFSRDGSLLARGQTSHPPACLPLLYRGKLIHALPDGSLRALNPSGRLAWETGPGSPVLLLEENPFTHTFAAKREGGGFEVYRSEDQDPSPWLLVQRSLPFDAAQVLSLAAGGFVIMGSGGRIVTLDEAGGFVEDFFLRDRHPIDALTDSVNAVFFAEDRGGLSSYSLGGSSLWTRTLSGRPRSLSLSPSSRYLAVATEDWVVQRFEFVQYGRNIPRSAPPPPPDPLRINISSSVYRGEYDFIYFMDRAASPNANRKKEILDVIAERLGAGGLQLSLDYAGEVLRYLAAEPYNTQTARSFPDIRAGALELLARMGEEKNRMFFSALLAQERDEFIIASVLAAMGTQASDPDQTMRRAILQFSQSRLRPDTRIDTAIIEALEDISRYHGGLGGYGRAALMQLQSRASGSLRRRIQELLTERP